MGEVEEGRAINEGEFQHRAVRNRLLSVGQSVNVICGHFYTSSSFSTAGHVRRHHCRILQQSSYTVSATK